MLAMRSKRTPSRNQARMVYPKGLVIPPDPMPSAVMQTPASWRLVLSNLGNAVSLHFLVPRYPCINGSLAARNWWGCPHQFFWGGTGAPIFRTSPHHARTVGGKLGWPGTPILLTAAPLARGDGLHHFAHTSDCAVANAPGIGFQLVVLRLFGVVWDSPVRWEYLSARNWGRRAP